MSTRSLHMHSVCTISVTLKVLINCKFAKYTGRHYSVDWTTGLDYWTGLLDSRKLPLEEKGTRLYRDSTPPYRKDVVI